ncbi:MAG: GNAT family N-acetyltransferase [Dehalococcoidia bacterium]
MYHDFNVWILARTRKSGQSRVSVSREIRPTKRAVKESSVDVREADADNPVMTLSDDVVTLRPWSRDDAGFMAEAYADPAIRRYNGVLDRLGRPTPPLSIMDAEAVIDEFALNWRAFATTGTPSGVAFAIMDARSGDLVGCCGVDDWSKADVAQFGYWIAASARGRGCATRAVILLTRWLFELGAARVFLTIVAENEESVAVARRAGFVYEGTMRSHGVWQGRRCDVMWFAALPLEWTMRGPDEQT